MPKISLLQLNRQVKSRKASSKKKEALRHYRKVATKADLQKLFFEKLHIRIPEEAVCEGHRAPLDFAWDVYSEKITQALVIANRNGGKTTIFAALEFVLASTIKKLECAHLGSIMAQSNNAWKYISKWCNRNKNDLNISKLTQRQTIFGNESTCEIIAGTMHGVNSPHPHKCFIDEFELLDWEIFEEAQSMPKSSNDIKAGLFLGTTRKFPNGNAQAMIDSANEKGFEVFKWCVFEVLEPCDCKGSGCDSKYDKHLAFDRSGKSRSWSDVCAGKAKNARGYFKLEDVLTKFKSMSWEKFAAQWLCHRPERADCVFPEFHYDKNVIESWEFNPELDNYRGWDFGLDDPNATVFAQEMEDGESLIIYDILVISGDLIDDFADKVNEKTCKLFSPHRDEDFELDEWAEQNHEKFNDFCDPSGKAVTGVSGQSYIGKLNDKGIWPDYEHKKVAEGIEDIKQMMRINSYTQKTRIFITKNCTQLINALEMSQWDRTEGKNKKSNEKYRHDEHSHVLDAFRYMIQGYQGGGVDVSY